MPRYIDSVFEANGSDFVDRSLAKELGMFDVLAVLRETERDAIFRIGEGGSICSNPVVLNGMVYFGACDKNFYAVDAETGNLKWKVRTDGPVCVGRSCTIHDNKIYFGSYDHFLYCLDMNGDLLWKFKTRDMVNSTPMIKNGVVYFGSRDQNMYAVDADNGKLIWKFWTHGAVSPSPAWADGNIYFGSFDKNLYAVTEQGRLLWKFKTNDFIVEPVETCNGIIYLPSTDRNLYALSPDGNLLWKFRTSGPVASKPVVHENSVYFGCSDHNLYKLNALSGQFVWKFRTRNIIYGYPVITEKMIYLCSCDENLYALNIEGKLVWKFKTQGVASSSPFLSRNVIYFGSWDCCLYAVTTDGRLLWKFRASSSGQAPVNLSDSHMESVGRNISGPLISDEPVTEGKRAERKSDYGKFSGNYLGENEDVLDITSMSGLVKQYGSSGKKYR